MRPNKPKLTLKEAKAEVAQWGYRLEWNREWEEYVVHVDGCRNDHMPCVFTDDRDDAVATAHDLYLRGVKP